MLELLCRIRYSRLFFVLISGGATTWFWSKIYQCDVATAVNGVVSLDIGAYLFSFMLILMLTFLVLVLLNLVFDLDFEYRSDKIQDYFRKKLKEREYEERVKAHEERDRAWKQQQQDAAEKAELAEFVKYCRKKGGIK